MVVYGPFAFGMISTKTEQAPTTADNQRPDCPVGEYRCAVIDELVTLRTTNAQLSELVRTDTLTGIYNYRFFIQSLEQEMERTRRSTQSTALILIDLDHFKRVNDTWGHEVGNEALVQTAQLMRRAVRKLDIPCRYGGEEFVIILPSTDLLTATQVAERLRELIATTPLAVSQGELKLTASLGVDVYQGGEEQPEDFVKRADHQMYAAKQEGRNRVCHAVSDRMESAGNVSSEEKNALFGLFGGDHYEDEDPDLDDAVDCESESVTPEDNYTDQ